MFHIDTTPSREELIGYLRELYHTILGTTRQRIREDDTIPFMCALLDPHAPTGAQFIYPYVVEEKDWEEAIDELNDYFQQVTPYGLVSLQKQGNNFVFSLLMSGFSESYILPITPDGNAKPLGPYAENKIPGLHYFRVS